MPTSCAVAVCTNVGLKGSHISFFKFPRDANLRKVWVEKCFRKDYFSPDTSYVCSSHFEDSDFENLMKVKLMGGKLLLKKDAFPKINLHNHPTIEKTEISRSKRYKKQKLEETVSNLINFPSTSREVSKQVLQEKEKTSEYTQKYLGKDRDYSILSETVNKNLLEQYKTKINELAQKNEILRNRVEKLEVENNQKGRELNVLNKKLKLLSSRSTEFNKKKAEKYIRETLQNVFTTSQLDILLNKNKKVHWTEKDISTAFTLRHFSRRCYTFLREKLHYPLPALGTLRRWCKKMYMESGVLTGVLKLLEVAGYSMSTIDKLIVLQFDEMKMSEKIEYDIENDHIMGPYKHLQVVQARSLVAKWKQPIYSNFDQKMTTDILNDLIVKLHHIGFIVVALVTDCGPTNTALWTEYNITIDKTWFDHPLQESKIYVFADTSHILKLIRNWLLDTGFQYENGIFISKTPLQTLLNLKNSDVSSIYKLTKCHLECSGTQRQHVSLATELLSHAIASDLKYYKCNGKYEEEYLHLANFIEIINDWFDVMNSYVPTASNPYKSGYGKSDTKIQQDEALQKCYDTISTIKCCGKSNLLKFQKGILISIKSLQNLFLDVKKEYNISYILTHKLNQDALENIFSHDTIVQTGTNSIQENYIVGKVLWQTGITLGLDDSLHNMEYSDSDSSISMSEVDESQNPSTSQNP